MIANSPSVAVVILSWNDWKNTTECVTSVMKSFYNNFDIIIIDNNSKHFHYKKLLNWCNKQKVKFNLINSKTKLSTKKKNRKNIYILRNKKIAKIPFAKKLGFTKGYNLGINFALKNDYDLIVKLDCDFIVTKNFLNGMTKTLVKNEDAVAVSSKVYYYLNKKTRILWWSGVNFTNNYFRFQETGKGANRKTIDKGQAKFKGIHLSDGICGCCVMLRSKTLKKTGTLDEDFFFGPEDIEHALRLKKYGKLLINLNYYTYHKVSRSIFVSGIKARIYHETIGWLLIIKKVCNKKDTLIGYAYFFIRALAHMIRLFYVKDKNRPIGFLLGIKDYFFKY